MFNVPSSTPTALLYLELGITPLRYIIKARRLTFLHYILTRKEDDLLLRFFKAQLLAPTKMDWCSQVKTDMEEFDIEDDFDVLKKMSKYKMKKIVKEAYKRKAFDDLLEIQAAYSKGEELVYGKSSNALRL